MKVNGKYQKKKCKTICVFTITSTYLERNARYVLVIVSITDHQSLFFNRDEGILFILISTARCQCLYETTEESNERSKS